MAAFNMLLRTSNFSHEISITYVKASVEENTIVDFMLNYTKRTSSILYNLFERYTLCLQDFDDSLLDGLVSIQPFNTGDDLVYDEYRDNPDEFKYEDDEDSNDEDNERNEYPDEDDEESSFKGYCDDGDLDLEMRVKGRGCQDYH